MRLALAAGMPRLPRFGWLALVLAVALLMPAGAAAQGSAPAPDHALFAEGALGGSLHREGALLDLRLRYRRRLYAADSLALRDNYAGVGVITQTSPAFSQNGAYAELAPASFLRLTAGYEAVAYFGTFDSLRPLAQCDRVAELAEDDPRCDFASPALGQASSTADLGHRVWLEGLLQGKLGPLVAVESFAVERWWFRESWNAGGAYRHWFNELYALPQRRADTVLASSGALLAEIVAERGAGDVQVLLGAASDLAYAAGTHYATHRVGPAVLARVPAAWGLRDLTAALVVQLYTHDRYVRGPLPFVALAFSAATENWL